MEIKTARYLICSSPYAALHLDATMRQPGRARAVDRENFPVAERQLPDDDGKGILLMGMWPKTNQPPENPVQFSLDGGQRRTRPAALFCGSGSSGAHLGRAMQPVGGRWQLTCATGGADRR